MVGRDSSRARFLAQARRAECASVFRKTELPEPTQQQEAESLLQRRDTEACKSALLRILCTSTLNSARMDLGSNDAVEMLAVFAPTCVGNLSIEPHHNS